MAPMAPMAPAPAPGARARALPLLAAAALLLAGCAQAPPSPVVEASGTGASVTQGYDHAAATLARGPGSFALRLDPRADAGTFEANFTWQGRAWQVAAERFAGVAPEQEGGVRAGFQARGATGQGDALLPAFPALVAAWGTGTARVGGAPWSDPFTGRPEVQVHVALSEARVRDPATGRVTRADGAAPYDPASPGDARLGEGMQLLLEVQGAPAPLPLRAQANDTIAGPGQNRTHPFDLQPGAVRLAVNLTVQPAGPAPVAPGPVSFVLTDPAAEVRGRWDYSPDPASPAGANHTLEVAPPLPEGTWALEVFGSVAGARYAAAIEGNYAEPLFLVVAYDEVRVAARGS